MTKLKVYIAVISLIYINALVDCQIPGIQLTNLKSNDPFVLKWDCKTLNKYPSKAKMLINYNFSQELRDLPIDTLFKNSNYTFYCRVELNPKLNTLIFLEKNIPDTLLGFPDDSYKFQILSFNKACLLLSICTIPIYERSSDGFRYSGLDTYLTFKNGKINIKEIHESKPMDLVVRFKVTEETFKKREDHIIQLDDNGSLSMIK